MTRSKVTKQFQFNVKLPPQQHQTVNSRNLHSGPVCNNNYLKVALEFRQIYYIFVSGVFYRKITAKVLNNWDSNSSFHALLLMIKLSHGDNAQILCFILQTHNLLKLMVVSLTSHLQRANR